MMRMSFLGPDVGALVAPSTVGADVAGGEVGPAAVGALVGDRGRIVPGRYPAGNRLPLGRPGLGRSRPLPLSSLPIPVPR